MVTTAVGGEEQWEVAQERGWNCRVRGGGRVVEKKTRKEYRDSVGTEELDEEEEEEEEEDVAGERGAGATAMCTPMHAVLTWKSAFTHSTSMAAAAL